MWTQMYYLALRGTCIQPRVHCLSEPFYRMYTQASGDVLVIFLPSSPLLYQSRISLDKTRRVS